MSSSTIELSEYKKRRDGLITLERALRADHKREPLSPAEISAEEVIRKLKATEAATLWSADYPSIPHPFPGMEFLTGTFSNLQIFYLSNHMLHQDGASSCRANSSKF
jgi:adenosine deaminase CECR1